MMYIVCDFKSNTGLWQQCCRATLFVLLKQMKTTIAVKGQLLQARSKHWTRPILTLLRPTNYRPSIGDVTSCLTCFGRGAARVQFLSSSTAVTTVKICNERFSVSEVRGASDRRTVTECYDLLRQAADCSDNVGVDESPGASLDDLSSFLARPTTSAYVLYKEDSSSHVVDALVFVSPCLHARTCHPTLCHLHLVASQSVQRRLGSGFWHQFATSAVRLAREASGSRFSACVTDVFVPCIERVVAFRKAGFVISACVPHAGIMANSKTCYVSSYIMYNEFEHRCETPTQMVQVEKQTGERFLDTKILSLPYLPVILPLPMSSRDQRLVTIRSLRPDEIAQFYAASQLAAENDQTSGSYGVDELSDLSYFSSGYVDYQYVTVVETCDTSQTVAYMSFGKSTYSRSARPVLNDANLIVLPEFRQNKWAPVLLMYNAMMSKDAGFIATQGEAAVINLASIFSMTRNGCVVNGVLPRAIYFHHTGWTDLVMTTLDLATVPSLLDFKSKLQSRPTSSI